jgi:rhodanese-related sulfurtransferase
MTIGRKARAVGGAAGLAALLACAAPAAQGLRVAGAPAGAPAAVVETGGGGTFLVDRGGAVEVIALAPGATLSGVATIRELRPGDAVRYGAGRSVGGVRVIEMLEVDPPLFAEPERMVPAAEAEPLVREGRATPVDARDEASFAEAHLPGAVSVAPARLGDLAALLPRDRTRPLLVYSGNERSPLALAAARAALAAGYGDVRVLAGGLRAWEARGAITAVSASHLVRAAERPAVADLRPGASTAAGVIPGSVAVPREAMVSTLFRGATWLPALVLVGEDERDPAPREAAERIRSWRGDDELVLSPIRVLDGGFRGWVDAGGPVAGPEALAGPGALLRGPALPGTIDRAELEALFAAGGGGKLLLDVRQRGRETPSFARHVPLEDLHERVGELPRDREVIVFCHVGRRARIAWEILARNGFQVRYLRDRPPPPP